MFNFTTVVFDGTSPTFYFTNTSGWNTSSSNIDTIYNTTCSGVIPDSVPVFSLDSIPLVRISDLDNPEAIKNTKVDQICQPW